jgi:CCR4-NOT transcription complex subunit 6
MQMQYLPEYINIRHTISILTYNVLAGCYCDKGVFRYAKDEHLYFAHRAKKIVDQLKIFDADIICF